MYSVEFIRNNIDSLSHLAPTWHPLGYVECQIAKDADLEVRIHLWLPLDRRTKTPSWPIHRHRFELQSTLICGEIFNLTYQELPGSTFRKYYVAPSSNDGVSSLSKSEDFCNLDIRDIRRMTTGDIYSVSGKDIHQAFVNEECETITLARTHNTEVAASIVFGDSDFDPTPYNRNLYNRLDFWQRVARAIGK